jgi:hypothetical protein
MIGVPNNADMAFPMSKSWTVSSDMFTISLREVFSSTNPLANKSRGSSDWGA